jgi:hypothetical protein
VCVYGSTKCAEERSEQVNLGAHSVVAIDLLSPYLGNVGHCVISNNF